jgi:hypothetical protein
MSNNLSEEEKLETILTKNTYFLKFPDFEKKYELHISDLLSSILNLKKRIESSDQKKKIILEFINSNPFGLQTILALTGFSNELLKRLTTVIRLETDSELHTLVNFTAWPKSKIVSEWGTEAIANLIKTNKKFAEGIINLLCDGSKNSRLIQILPVFEIKKLNIANIDFSIESLLETLLRYKFKGSLKAEGANNSENKIFEILDRMKIKYVTGKIKGIGRDMDVIIPDKTNPEILIEVSFQATTASAMGDKAKKEVAVKGEMNKHYPKCTFLGFVDGMGWYARQSDLRRILTAFSDVFTFSSSELSRFEQYLKNNISSDCYAKN